MIKDTLSTSLYKCDSKWKKFFTCDAKFVSFRSFLNRAASLAETIHRPISSSRLRAEEEKILPSLDVRATPHPPSSPGLTIPGERRRRRRDRAVTWYFVLGSRYVLPAILYILAPFSSPTFPRPQRRRLPHPERWGYRTNSEFDDPNGGSELARAPPDTTRYSNADLGSGEARREPTDTAVIHLAAGFRDSLTFLRIGPFADASLRDVGRLAARGRSSCGRQDVTPLTAGGRSTDKKLFDVYAWIYVGIVERGNFFLFLKIY